VGTKLYNTEEAAEEAGISRFTLQEWIRRGIVQGPKLQIRNGRAVRLWTTSDVTKLKSVDVPMGRPKKGKKSKGLD
jgi:predicted site-specific integrase-resolvase